MTRKRALGNQASGASRTFVVANASGQVMGYCALAAGAVAHATETGAVRRTIGVAADAGIRALLVHALSERAREFYLHYGFEASTLHPLTRMMRLPSSALGNGMVSSSPR